jgi:cobalamin-dependent methionine synthase I
MNIDKKEVLRYLGYNNQALDQVMENLLEECVEEIKEVLKKNYVYYIYDIERQKDRIRFKETNLVFQSKDLSQHLQNSDKCALLAATLGLEIDKRLAYYSRLNLTKGIVLDASATTAIEALCDEVQEEMREKAEKEGYYLTTRYSPGYGDLAIDYQKDILEALKAYSKIGLSLTKDYIMLPRKSVTAFIGWQREEMALDDKCSICKDKNCTYRKCGRMNE